jgi:hypothetical protein
MWLSNRVKRAKDIVLSPDFLVSLGISVLVWIVADSIISNEFSRDIYSVGITVLSIVFSVYFAALAIIISSSDDEFVDFLEQEGDYTTLIKNFRFSLTVLLIALVYSIVLYTLTTIWFYNQILNQPGYLFILFVFIFIYGLLATFAATNDAIRYSLYRAKFLRYKREHRLRESRKIDNENPWEN